MKFFKIKTSLKLIIFKLTYFTLFIYTYKLYKQNLIQLKVKLTIN